MKLDSNDFSTIAEYIRSANPGYDGPVIIDFNRLDDAFMDSSKLFAMTAILKMKCSCNRPSK